MLHGVAFGAVAVRHAGVALFQSHTHCLSTAHPLCPRSAAMAVLRQQKTYVQQLYESGIIDEPELEAMAHPVQVRLMWLDALAWRVGVDRAPGGTGAHANCSPAARE